MMGSLADVFTVGGCPVAGGAGLAATIREPVPISVATSLSARVAARAGASSSRSRRWCVPRALTRPLMKRPGERRPGGGLRIAMVAAAAGGACDGKRAGFDRRGIVPVPGGASRPAARGDHRTVERPPAARARGISVDLAQLGARAARDRRRSPAVDHVDQRTLLPALRAASRAGSVCLWPTCSAPPRVLSA
jgi:hypothetical protein